MSHITQFQHLKIQLQDIISATNNFSDDYYIGRGGFGRVYKGELVLSGDKTMVALKRLDRVFGQGDPEFWKEIMMLSFYRHENIVSLLGYCDDHGEKILVYEYASKRSLESYLASDDLTWVQRLRLCVGAAQGLSYLHTPTESQLRIVHRDIKSSNILLDNNWNAKISDFGLAKFAPANKVFSYLVSYPVGTPGYIDPLYHETGLLTKESDVYSFGVVLFEVLCGRLCYGNNLKPLVGLVREYYEQSKINELVCSSIKDEKNTSSLDLFADIAYQCLNRKREERPSMTQILSSLLDLQARVHGNGILNVKVLTTIDPDHYLVLYTSYLQPVHNIKKSKKYKKKLDAERNENEEFSLYVENIQYNNHLYILVNNVLSERNHCFLGMALVQFSGLTPGIPLTCILAVIDDNYHHIDDLKVELLYKPTDIKDLISSIPNAPIGTPKDGGLLVIIIKCACLLNRKHKHSSVSLQFRGELRKTKSMMNTNKPVWIQEFTFMLRQPPTDENLYLEVINHYWWMGLVSRKKSIGHVDIKLAEVVHTKWINKKYDLKPAYLDGEYRVPTVAEGDSVRWIIEIYQKESSSPSSIQRVVFSRYDVAELEPLIRPGSCVDVYFSLDPYDYHQNAGIRLVVKKLIVDSN